MPCKSDCVKFNMKNLNSLILLISIYLAVQIIGLNVGLELTRQIESSVIPAAVENPESASSSVQIFLYILLMTGILLIFIRFKLDLIIKALLFFGIFGGIFISFWSIFGDYALALTSIMIILTVWQRKNPLLMNFTLIWTISGIGGYLGASLHFIPSLILLVILSAYDIIAVFWTKHMVMLAKEVKDKLPLFFAIPVGKKILGLGTGDLAIPLVFSVSVLSDYGINHALLTIAGGLFGIISLFFYISKKREIALPALPPIAIGLILGFLVSWIY